MSDSGFDATPPPDPVELADLLVRATRLQWPTTEDERRNFFTALGLRDLGAPETPEADPRTVWRRFTTALPGEADGSAVTSHGEFLALHVVAYNQQGDDGTAAREGFGVLRKHLGGAFGPPAEEWGTPQEPACVWLLARLTLEMYCFQRGSSGVTVGLSHTQRSAARQT